MPEQTVEIVNATPTLPAATRVHRIMRGEQFLGHVTKARWLTGRRGWAAVAGPGRVSVYPTRKQAVASLAAEG